MKLLMTISGLIFGTALLTTMSAQVSECNIIKSFPVSEKTTFHISNKFGDINVVTVNEKNLSVCAIITINHEHKEIGEKSIQLINVDLSRTNDSISAVTSYDKKFFSSTYREGRKSFRVDYVIKTPAFINISIINSFGNLTIEELSGSVNIRLSRGILTAKRLTRGNSNPINSIYVDHCDVSLSNMNWLSLTTRKCPSVTIEKVHALMMISDFSKISIEEIGSLVSDSKYDSYNIESIKNMVSESLYSTFEIENLSGQLKSVSAFGSIKILEIMKEFNSIDIISNHTPISINTDDVSFKADLSATNNPIEFNFDDEPGITKVLSNNKTTITGVAGKNHNTNSVIRIRTTDGRLSIK